jgi:hypothetical protein
VTAPCFPSKEMALFAQPNLSAERMAPFAEASFLKVEPSLVLPEKVYDATGVCECPPVIMAKSSKNKGKKRFIFLQLIGE